jgi:hypothetical protein
VEVDRVVPASGNLAGRIKQFWLGPPRRGVSGPTPPASRVLRVANVTTYGGPGPSSLCRPWAKITSGKPPLLHPHATRAHPNPDRP